MSQNPTAIEPASPGRPVADAQPAYWQSLEQLQEPNSTSASSEFAEGASEPPVLDDVSRRNFLGIAAATAALAGLTSCRKPFTHIIPFAQRPEDLVPGNPRYYATAYIKGGIGTGILVKSSDGRPTKVEGNTLHPSSLGATDHLMQAELLNLYDPARSKNLIDKAHDAIDKHGHAHHPSLADFHKHWAGAVSGDGSGFHILMEPTSSPSVHAALTRLQAKYRKVTVHHWAPVNESVAVAATTYAFGRPVVAQYDLEKADVVVSVDCDFQSQDGDNVRNARAYANRRRVTSETEADKLSRLYALESCHSITGSNADHRMRLRPSEIGVAVLALAAELKAKHNIPIAGDYAGRAAADSELPEYEGKAWIPILAKELASKKGKAVLVVGPRLPVEVQVICHAINHGLGAVGATVSFTPSLAGLDVDCGKSIAGLATAMSAGSVSALMILGGNPVYNAPVDLDFKGGLAKVEHKVHLSLFEDETTAECDWQVNQAHDLETWGDILGHDGTATLMQPLIAPLYDGISTLEMIALLTDTEFPVKVKIKRKMIGGVEVDAEVDRSGYQLVRDTWRARATGSFETFWARALHDGLVPATKSATIDDVTPNTAAIVAAVSGIKASTKGSLDNLEVQFRPGYNMHDGRHANNSWLMELPDPMTKITWDNAALISLSTMTEAGLENGDQVDITIADKTVRTPVWVLPGHADHAITLTLGYGRNLGEDFHVANGAGYDAYSVRTTANHDGAVGAKISEKVGWYKLALTQEHGTLEGRALVRENDVAGYKADPKFAPGENPLAQMEKAEHDAYVAKHKDHGHKMEHKPHQDPEKPHSLWKPSELPPQFDYSKGNQWGMVIDLNTCIGCNACVSACVSENNIAMVGKEQISKGREMFWNRIDRYFGSNTKLNVKSPGLSPALNAIPAAENPRVVHQMVPCMQCENASCEVVCPVAATNHSPEGLNDMAYNRCIGTRYCGNNCPYKVRRFNYLDFHGDVPEQTKMTRNPDVTIRSRGVMEKCTYCVQRINREKIKAHREERRDIVDGDIQTACEQSCPTQAITFGNIIGKNAEGTGPSRVAALKASNLNYAMLAELNMRPRTTYLAKIRNPNPELVS